MGSVYGTSFLNAFVDGSQIVLVARDGSGRRTLSRVPAEWVSYFRTADLPSELQRDLLRSSHVLAARREGPWLRVSWRSREAREWICQDRASPVVAQGVPTYEGDVDPVRRWLTDSPCTIARPRLVYLDIETDSRVPFSRKEEMRVLAWTLVEPGGKKVHAVLRADTDAGERDLLRQLWAELAAYDCVVAWNGGDPIKREGFDFPVIVARTDYVGGITVDPREWLWLDHLPLFKRMNMHAAESGAEKRSFKLQSIAMAVVGEGKDDFDASRTWEAWEADGAERLRMQRYNIKDTDLLRRIEEKTGYIGLFFTICEVCKLFPQTQSLHPTRQMDGFLLRLGQERGHHFPTRIFRDGSAVTEQFEGALVMEPKVLDAEWRARRQMVTGILREVHVADFASLYPSIMITMNMGAETKVAGAPVQGPIPEGLCRAPITGVSFSTREQSILAFAVEELIRLRKVWGDKKASLPPGTPEWYDADRRSMAYKVCANSFYGVTGSPFSRYFDASVAESVTQTGVWLLKLTSAEAEKRGWEVIYADTDSIFTVGCTREDFAKFVEWCNTDLYPRAIREQGCTVNKIKLAYEKAFDRLLFTAGKRYVGRYSHYKGKAATADSKPEIKGLEYKRGDVSLLAVQLQERVMKMILDGEERLAAYEAVILRDRAHVLEEPLTLEEIVKSQALSKPLKEYGPQPGKDPTPEGAHVRVAKVLLERGQDVGEGTRVEFVVTDASVSPMHVIPAEDFDGTCDRYYVWDTLVWPATERLLSCAFPSGGPGGGGWESYGRVRPQRKSPLRGGAGEGQGALWGPPVPAANRLTGTPTVPAALPKPLVVELHEARLAPPSGLEKVKAVLARFPGTRPVHLRLVLATGAVALLTTSVRVQPSPALDAALAPFRAA